MRSRLVSTPPSSSPTAPPPTAMALQTPSAVVRSRPSANVVVSTESAAGVTSAPPSPWSARPATRIPADPASPFINDAAENSTIPIRKRRLRPDEVGGATTEHEKATERERVRVDDPLQARGREVQPALDGGKRDVHDGVVEDDHELGEADDDEDEPGVDAFWLHVFVLFCDRIGAWAPVMGYYTERWFRLSMPVRSTQVRTIDEYGDSRSRAARGCGAQASDRHLRADAQRNRERILEAATTLMATHGIDVSIDAIAELAQVGVGTLYRNFPTKGALFEALLMARIAPLVGRSTRCRGADDAADAFIISSAA